MKLFYPRFALDAIRKNKRLYIPYILTTAFVSAMYFILRSLSLSEMLRSTFGGSETTLMLSFGSNVIAIFAIIFLFYTGSFLMKQRKQEFGLYSVLGMEKRHIAKILLFETIFIALLGVLIGLIVGAVLNWASFLLLMKLIGGGADEPFTMSLEAFYRTAVLFAGIFLLLYLNNLRQVQFSSTISLLKSGSEGEREPRSKWPLTVLGLLFLGAGYAIALVIKNPIGAFAMFFVAVILVILGTYCLFTSGSIVFLKLLRRKKNYYYKTNHFISVSGMLYRMKQNAVSLGNICILSAMVLVTMSTTMCLYTGCDDIVADRYPMELNLNIFSSDVTPERNQRAKTLVRDLLEEQGAAVQSETQFSYLSFGGMRDGSQIITDIDERTLMGELTAVTDVTVLFLSDYNTVSGSQVELAPQTALLYGSEGYGYDEITVFDRTYAVEKLETFDIPCSSILISDAMQTILLVLPDTELEHLNKVQREVYGENASNICTYLGMDVDPQAGMAVSGVFHEKLSELQGTASVEEDYDFWMVRLDSREEEKDDFLELYAGMFFIGIFLGALFLVAAILIIYYKQLSEGLQDQRRYGIMRKVGLTDKEIRSSIHSQVLTVFFLPLLMAFVHMAFAFPMVQRCLNVLNMSNSKAFLLCMLICCGVFAVVYLAVYVLTSKVYYRIVNQAG